MLQKQTVTPGTLEILKELMRIPELSEFFLAGGTALSLQYGHRKSIDLDLFSVTAFDNQELASILENKIPAFSYFNVTNEIGLFGFIQETKVDFIKYHNHPLIRPGYIKESIRFLSTEDIIAMKINAILKRGLKKDFWDIAELLDNYSVSEIIKLYVEKYPSQQLTISIPQALVYFDDAEISEDPISLKGQTWHSVKEKIQEKVRKFLA